MNNCKVLARCLSGLIAFALLIPCFPVSVSNATSSVDEPTQPGPRPVLRTSSIHLLKPYLAPLISGCGGSIVPVVNDTYEQEVVALVNQERTSRGIPPIKRVSSLDEAARYHSTDLGQDDYFAHDSYDRLDGELVYACSPWSRIASYYDGARGENIAAGYPTPESVVSAWMNSDGHRANILSGASWEIGVGYFEGAGGYYTYWTQDFGRQDGVYPLIINNDALETDNTNVSLYIYGTWSEIRLHNDMDEWTEWLPFTNDMTWQLPPRNGLHTVLVEMRDGVTTATSQDTITVAGYASDPKLCNLTEAITFTYDIASQTLFPSNVLLTPENVGSSDPLNWSIDVQGDWFSVSPGSGSSPESFTINPSQASPPLETAVSGVITLTVTSPTNTLGSPHEIKVSMVVVSGTLRTIYIPLLVNPIH